MPTLTRSLALFEKANQFIPGGVNSPVRAFKAMGGNPIFFKRGAGAHVWDEDGNQYIDYVGSWGPLILGHAHPKVIHAVQETAAHGLTFGAPTALEAEIAELICQLVPSMEQVRLVSTGTEAAMSALRLARAYTGRHKIIKFIGCYHGHTNELLIQAGSGALTFGAPSSPGVPPSVVQDTLLATFNDAASVEALMAQYGDEVAAIIVEPIAANMNCLPPVPGFLQKLRDVCDKYGSLLIFDEVITGFRVSLGGAQAHYNITPDLTLLGKIIGGGMPIGAFGGKKAIMQYLSPVGAVYQAGTLSGNPVAVSSGLATLREIQRPDFYEQLERNTVLLCDGFASAAKAANIPVSITRVGSIFGWFFTAEPEITQYEQIMRCDTERFKRFFHGMLAEGVYLAPSSFEVGFVSAAHTKADIEKTIAAAERVLKQIE